MSSQSAGDLFADIGELFEVAERARRHAWAPYSRFSVGAALESDEGRIFGGCNVENASYPAGICAERVALGTAIAAGERKFSRLLITSSAGDPVPPCGLCRQALVEFSPSLEVITVASGSHGTPRVLRWSLADLLPTPFSPASLGNA